jgi:riboflavin kinase/FMN adenylyltransferase
MEEIRDLAPRNSGVTLGVFDGVHQGHRHTIEHLADARKSGKIDGAFLITFDPHPLVITHSKMMPPLLTTIDERVYLLSRLDLDGIVVLKFDDELANVDYRAFLEKYLLRPFDMNLLVLGYDCHFGKNREGSPEKVREEGERTGLEVKVVPAKRSQDEIVSSTKIRNALMEGDVARGNRLLGHPYLVSGIVVRGEGRGKGLGFPTANLSIGDQYKLWPPRGVYAVQVERAGKMYGGMMNVGSAPTIKSLDGRMPAIEVHLFDLSEDLYGESLRVFCHTLLRQEQRFPSPEALVAQLEQDRLQAIECLGTGQVLP